MSRNCSFAHFRVPLAASVFWHIINGHLPLEDTHAYITSLPPPCLTHVFRCLDSEQDLNRALLSEHRFICPHATLELCLLLVISNLSFLVVFLYNRKDAANIHFSLLRTCRHFYVTEVTSVFPPLFRQY